MLLIAVPVPPPSTTKNAAAPCPPRSLSPPSLSPLSPLMTSPPPHLPSLLRVGAAGNGKLVGKTATGGARERRERERVVPRETLTSCRAVAAPPMHTAAFAAIVALQRPPPPNLGRRAGPTPILTGSHGSWPVHGPRRQPSRTYRQTPPVQEPHRRRPTAFLAGADRPRTPCH
jgi:hypothetical protein